MRELRRSLKRWTALVYKADIIIEELMKKLRHDAETQYGVISTYADKLLKQLSKMQEKDGGYYGSNQAYNETTAADRRGERES